MRNYNKSAVSMIDRSFYSEAVLLFPYHVNLVSYLYAA